MCFLCSFDLDYSEDIEFKMTVSNILFSDNRTTFTFLFKGPTGTTTELFTTELFTTGATNLFSLHIGHLIRLVFQS